ncbi:hypothetical protein C0992_010539 [Termitomyces sp. T32_za158]|nr:hypothetical protein C0992_010539 [Termitomyces sp. T32_za158]
MSVAIKLTKKQKKGIAFRERKIGNRRSKDGNGVHNSEDNDVPVMEDQDALATEGAPVEMEEVAEGTKKSKSASKVSGEDDQDEGKYKAKADEEDTEHSSSKSKKRKRQDANVDAPESAEEKQPVAKRKKSVEDVGESGQDTKVAAKSKQRFILFLGNLKYTTTHDTIAKHFAACDPPPAIRLLTPKSTRGKPNIKSKGCAFLGVQV